MRWKIISLALLILLLCTNVYWFNTRLDAGVTLSYHDQVTYEFANQIKELSRIINLYINDLPADSIKKVLRIVSSPNDVFEKDSTINSPWVTIRNIEGTPREVVNNELVEQWSRPDQK